MCIHQLHTSINYSVPAAIQCFRKRFSDLLDTHEVSVRKSFHKKKKPSQDPLRSSVCFKCWMGQPSIPHSLVAGVFSTWNDDESRPSLFNSWAGCPHQKCPEIIQTMLINQLVPARCVAHPRQLLLLRGDERGVLQPPPLAGAPRFSSPSKAGRKRNHGQHDCGKVFLKCHQFYGAALPGNFFS